MKHEMRSGRMPGMGTPEFKDTVQTTEQIRSFKLQNKESLSDLERAAQAIDKGKERIIVKAGGQDWESVKGKEGIVWMPK